MRRNAGNPRQCTRYGSPCPDRAADKTEVKQPRTTPPRSRPAKPCAQKHRDAARTRESTCRPGGTRWNNGWRAMSPNEGMSWAEAALNDTGFLPACLGIAPAATKFRTVRFACQGRRFPGGPLFALLCRVPGGRHSGANLGRERLDTRDSTGPRPSRHGGFTGALPRPVMRRRGACVAARQQAIPARHARSAPGLQRPAAASGDLRHGACTR